MKYLILIEKVKRGYSVYSPDIPGCVATGSTKEEAEQAMKEAIGFHIEGLMQEGYEIPLPHTFAEYLDVSA